MEFVMAAFGTLIFVHLSFTRIPITRFPKALLDGAEFTIALLIAPIPAVLITTDWRDLLVLWLAAAGAAGLMENLINRLPSR